MYLDLLLAGFALLSSASAADIYAKTSGVLQIEASNYDRLIAKSNYTSIVEFYAPWCGHCKNLAPAYAKAATSLAGIARVAAINCDEEPNKPFCSSMGVQGFPTLKLVRPSKKPGGKPMVEDYQGQRTAKAINDAVLEKVPNHVTRLKDAEVDAWLAKDTTRPKALFFSDKGVVSPLVKALAVDFLGALDVAQVKSSEKKTVEKYGVTTYPSVVLLPTTSDAEPLIHTGDMKKPTLLTFLSQATSPNPDANPDFASTSLPKPKSKPKPSAAKKDKPASPPRAASETLENSGTPPTASPDPQVSPDAPQPVRLPVEPAPQLLELADEVALQKSCLHTKAGLCILAFPPETDGTTAPDAEPATSAQPDASTLHVGLTALSEIAHKHRQRGAKLFPFYSVPGSNAYGQTLLSSLSATAPATDGDAFTVLAINAKRGWYSTFNSPSISRDTLESWIDNIRFGEVSKTTLPDGLITELQEQVGSEQPSEAPKVNAKKINLEDLLGGGGFGGEDSPFKIEVVELDDDDVPVGARAHDEL